MAMLKRLFTFVFLIKSFTKSPTLWEVFEGFGFTKSYGLYLWNLVYFLAKMESDSITFPFLRVVYG